MQERWERQHQNDGWKYIEHFTDDFAVVIEEFEGGNKK